MKGDFTKDTFDPIQNFSRVLMQQGRVQLDADFNEQTAILLHYLRMMMVDLAGPYGRPANPDGTDNEAFKITRSGTDIKINAGRYYVDGIPCMNYSDATYKNVLNVNKAYYVYLDVWERHITHVQDDRIREKALGGPDTCTRAQVVWRINLEELGKDSAATPEDAKIWLGRLPKFSDALMKARVRPERSNDDACSVPPESRYRGAENQLYRIEIHRGGTSWDGKTDKKSVPAGNAMQAATFKWSRDNGSIVFPIVRQQGNIVTLQSLGRDERTSLKVSDWVEITDDGRELQGTPGIMAQVEKVDLVEMTVTLKQPDDVPPSEFPRWGYDEKSTNHPLLRRWDHRAMEDVWLSQGAILITERSKSESDWIEIEDGIEIQFQPDGAGVKYRTGDYWLVPARMATGKIEWPTELTNAREEAKAMPPHGIEHHYAPLAVISTNHQGLRQLKDCRCTFHPLCCESV